MTTRIPLTAWRPSRVRRGRAPLVPPPRVASTQEPQVSEKLDGPDRATGSGPDCDEWTPAETAVATISVDGRVHDITVSPDGEHVYVARSDSVMVLNGRHHIVGKIPVSGSTKSLVMDADGKQLVVVDYDGSVLVVDTRDYTVQTPWGG
jgi:DNA-binding beta-propeller fold protein YncE